MVKDYKVWCHNHRLSTAHSAGMVLLNDYHLFAFKPPTVPVLFNQKDWVSRSDRGTGWIRSKQEQLRQARKVPQLAPPVLETVRAWLKWTHHAWFARRVLIFEQKTTN